MNAVVTGATKGIGKAICLKLASNGVNLAICSRNTDDLRQLDSELKQINPKLDILYQSCDVSNKEDLDKFGHLILDKWDQADILINNAGIFIPGALHQEAEGALEKMIETNLYSAYRLTRTLLPRMIDRQAGHIINMCSIASQMAYPNGGSYSISKFAMLGFSKVLREELKTHGIRVTAVLPGATWSNSWKGVDLPASRLMQAEDIAHAVWNAITMGPQAVVEEIIIRPQLGDL